MNYSYLAETLLDFAVAEAKRKGSERVLPIHLLVAIRKWNSEKFDQLFSEAADQINQALEAMPNADARPTGPDEETEKLLLTISTPADAWDCAEKLLKSDSLAVTAQSTNSQSRTKTKEKEIQEESSDELLTIGITSVLISDIAQVLQQDPANVTSNVFADIAFVSRLVIGKYGQEEATQFSSATDIEFPASVESPTDAHVLNLLVNSESANAQIVAREYALALVSIASFAASLDDTVTEEEIAAIDNLRLEFREVLGQRTVASPHSHFASFDDAFRDIIGLENVKKELRQRIDYFVVAQRRRARGLSTAGQSMHMAFLGNPGTGKTTIARAFAAVLADMQLLPNKELVEVDRSGLVGEFVGHTEKKTNEVIDSALGGVLFIDEAYSLVDEHSYGKSFGDLAIDTLVKRMEDDRDRLMVVVAGYAEPMKQFLESNEGLKSRIPLELHFPDYSVDELVQVAERFATKEGYQLDESCTEKFKSAAERISVSDLKGNARDIRNMYEQAVRNQHSRVAKMGDLATTKELVTLTGEDVPDLEQIQPEKKKQIGFR